MGFEPPEWQLQCPQCGHQKIEKTTDGTFVCGSCECEFRHNWKAWIIVAPPWIVLLVVMLYTFATLGTLPKIVLYSLLAVCAVAYFVSPECYRVQKPGHSEQTQDDKGTEAE